MYPSSLQELIEAFKYLPGVGEKTAERMAFAILDMDEETLKSIQKISNNMQTLADIDSEC